MCFNLALSIITRKLWSHHRLHTCAHTLLHTHHSNTHVTNTHRWMYTTPPNASSHTHPAELWDYSAISATLSPGKKNMFYHFISFLSSALPPSLGFPTQQHVAPPQTPVLKSQATSRALTAAPCFCWCDLACVDCVCSRIAIFLSVGPYFAFRTALFKLCYLVRGFPPLKGTP